MNPCFLAFGYGEASRRFRAALAMRGDVGYLPHVDRTTALTRLKAHEAELRAMGVLSLSLFGSVARDEAGPGSDVDLLARVDRERVRTLFDLGGLVDHVEGLLDVRVDLLTEPVRKPRLAAEVERDRVHVF